MQGLDSTAVIPALPHITAAYNAPELAAHVLLAAYFIGCGASLPVVGWACDRYGAKRVLMVAITVFVLGSIISALAPTLSILTATRFIQGGAAASLIPVARVMAVRTVEPKSLLKTITALTTPPMIGQTVGPAIGGWLAQMDMWRLIFFAGLPFALTSLVIIGFLALDTEREETDPLDWGAVVLSIAAMGCAVVGLGTLRVDGPHIGIPIVAIVMALTLGTLFVKRNLQACRPLIDFNIFSDQTFRLSCIGGMLFRLMVGSTPFLLAYHFQNVLGLDALKAGLLITASGAGTLIAKPYTSGILKRLGYRKTLLTAGLLALIGFIVPAFSTSAWPLAIIAIILVSASFMRSVEIVAFGTLSYADLPKRSASSISVVSSLVQQISHAMGVAIAAGALSLSALYGAPMAMTSVVGFTAIAMLAGVGLISFARLKTSAGSHMI